MSWPTKIPAAYTAPLGLELHVVLFEPANDRGGRSAVVGVQIPEATRPLIRRGLEEARRRRARLIFLCDTAEQADRIAATAAAALPDHRRIAIERAAAGRWGLGALQ